jgi:hypothetical protein
VNVGIRTYARKLSLKPVSDYRIKSECAFSTAAIASSLRSWVRIFDRQLNNRALPGRCHRISAQAVRENSGRPNPNISPSRLEIRLTHYIY